MFVQFEYGAAFQLFGYLGFYIGVSGFEVGRGFAAAGGFGDVSGQFVKRACVRALRQGLVGPFGNDRDARPVIAVLLFFKKLPALGEAFFRAAHPGFVVLQAVFDDGGKVEADLAV